METTEKLDPDFKKKWVAALRSGEYEQGRDWLHKNGKYCCLGVACAVAGISIDEIGDEKYTNRLAARYSGILPVFFQHISFGDDAAWGLAKRNDEGETFTELADWIEENL